MPQHTKLNITLFGSVIVCAALHVAPTAFPMMYLTLSWNTSLFVAVAASAACALWS